jgi:hypothetical protein
MGFASLYPSYELISRDAVEMLFGYLDLEAILGT